MALVSPGTQVTLTDESFFIPAGAGSVPLFFIATADEKFQTDGVSPAAGTYEYSKVRTVTTVEQVLDLYGVPRFLTDLNGNAHHGDARNEYGLHAVINYLGIANKAYVVRANVNLNDNFDDLVTMWTVKMDLAGALLENLGLAFIEEFNLTNGYIAGDTLFKISLTALELASLADEATAEVFLAYSFNSLNGDFYSDQGVVGIPVFPSGFDMPSVGTYYGFDGDIAAWVTNTSGTSANNTEWTPNEARVMLSNTADDFSRTVLFRTGTTLGANDAAKRLEIVTAFQAEINSNSDVRAETLEYNLVAAPGYFETTDELAALAQNMKDEILVVSDTPMDLTPSDTVTWASSSSRVTSDKVAYYYPSGIMSNVDGVNISVPASTMAIRTIAYNDLVGQFWTSPAGVRRGIVNGVTSIGYVSGTLGGVTVFNESNLSEGQRDGLYKDFTNINPITRLPGRGLLVFGQKVSASATSSLDRINVQRLLMYIRRQIRKNTLPYLFEPGDQKTRDNLKAAVDGFLGDIVVKRGLFDFVTKCDESNNSPSAIARHELTIEILLKPTIDVEFIHVPIRVLSPGASF